MPLEAEFGPRMVTLAAVRTSSGSAFPTLQSADALRGGVPAATHTAEFPCPAVLLDMPEGLTLEAPQGLRGVTPDGVHTPGA